MAMMLPAQRGAHPFIGFFTGLGVLGLSVWIFLLVLRSVYGRYDFTSLVPSTRSILAVLHPDRHPIAILSSGYSEKLIPEGSTWLQDNIRTWRRFVASTENSDEVIGDSAIEQGGLGQYAVVILPGAKALSSREIMQIKKFIDGGGSVFATSGTGSFTEDGRWRGWDFLSEVFGLQFSREIRADDPVRLHTLRGGLPITAGIPTGFSLNVATWDQPIACEVLEARTTQVSYWYNFQSDSGLAREGMEQTAGIVYGTYGRGRFVWMGFELNSVLGSQKDYVYFDILCRHSVDWLSGRPSVLLHDWPGGYRAAALVVTSASSEVANVPRLLDVLRAHNVPATFFFDPDSLTTQAPVVSRLSSTSSLGVLVGFPSGAPMMASAGTLPPDDGTISPVCEAAATRMEHILFKRPGGALQISGASNDASIQMLLNSKFEYVVTDSMTDRAVPEAITKGEVSLVKFAKTARGDDEVIREFGLRDTAYQLYTYKEDVDRVLFQGGLYLLRLHSQLQCRPDFIGVVDALAGYMRAKNFWFPTPEELCQWWLARSAMEVSCTVRSDRRLALVISNPSNLTIRKPGIQVNLNRSIRKLEIRSDIIGTDVPPYVYDQANQQIQITLPELEAGQSRSYYIDID